ncbi:hypothetical protein AB0J90_00595 [Micromonospora sp. NPDC049523]|uniref:hypothetical protein n=1 Tax=Micromonospora sp. NPDC049523 TaxID=3155921 RepID=UPI0034350E3E
MRRLLAIIATAAALVVGGAIAPTAASAAAYEANYAVSASYIQGDCIGTQELDGCFKKYGDQWGSQSWSSGTTRLEWQNQLWNGSRWVLYREGVCINNLGLGEPGVCNKDYYEDSSLNAYGSYGSRVRMSLCNTTCSGWSSWLYNNA